MDTIGGRMGSPEAVRLKAWPTRWQPSG